MTLNEYTEKIEQLLQALEYALNEAKLWQDALPEIAKLTSREPFCIDTLTANEWLQWVFIPRIRALLEADKPLPSQFTMVPYFEESLKEPGAAPIIHIIKQLETLLYQHKMLREKVKINR